MQRKRTHLGSLILLAAALTVAPAALIAQTTYNEAQPNQQMQQTQQQQGQPSSHSAHPQQTAAPDSYPTAGATGQEMKDKMFLRKSAAGGLAEVKMGQLAAEKGDSEEVKSFGARMVADHTMLSNSMKPIADSLGVHLPRDLNKQDQAEYDKLSALSGADFDREYIGNMVKDHHKDLREFHMEAMATNDPTLKEAVEKGESVIREHSRMITKIAREKGVTVAPADRPDTPPPPAQ